MAAKPKKPTFAETLKASASELVPRFDQSALKDYAKDSPSWIFNKFDFPGPFGDCEAKVRTAETVDMIHRKLCDFEKMTWEEILRNTWFSHSIEPSELCKEARDRLVHLKLDDDVERLFRFRFSGTERLWGIRHKSAFIALWWDPDHLVCPSEKKHT